MYEQENFNWKRIYKNIKNRNNDYIVRPVAETYNENMSNTKSKIEKEIKTRKVSKSFIQFSSYLLS